MNDDGIGEIRAVLDLPPTRLVEHWDNYAELYEWADHERSRRIRAILDRPAPAPRVWFAGDTLPRGAAAMNEDGDLVAGAYRVMAIDGPLVELGTLSPEEFKAAVNRARAEREVQP